MRLMIATDAWEPQVNGVVRTLQATISELGQKGVDVDVIEPGQFRNAPMPGYPEIRIAWPHPSVVRERLRNFQPDYIHIATEGPIGWAVRRTLRKMDRPFTTSYHTRFPEYARTRLPVPLALSYRALRRFHNAGVGVMVATNSIAKELTERGFRNVLMWGRGVDLSGFKRGVASAEISALPRPVFLNVGRVAPEKNLEAFLCLDLPGTKVVVGDGPAAPDLKRRFPQTIFLGARLHHELAAIYSAADVFVFPSLTDTFGLVLIEALACGLPVAAFPVAGPVDILADSHSGVMSTDLREAALAALGIDRVTCRKQAESFTWTQAAEQFLNNIQNPRRFLDSPPLPAYTT
jgi:glycosyltransferase involved in cell wall biosynthesis